MIPLCPANLGKSLNDAFSDLGGHRKSDKSVLLIATSDVKMLSSKEKFFLSSCVLPTFF